MTLQQIKDAIKAGKAVHWNNNLYQVLKDNNDNYNIVCLANGSVIGLTWLDGVTMNGKESEFYCK